MLISFYIFIIKLCYNEIMNETLRQSFEEQLVYLPEINQQALKSFDWATELLAIGKNSGLHIDELEDLQVETMLVLVGLSQPSEYQNELITRLAISPTEANKIIEQVNQRVFKPIHDYIVNGGPKKPTTPAGVMESAGFEITNDDTPLTPVADKLVRVGGIAPSMQIPPEVNPVTQSAPVSPLQFHPEESKTTTPEIPTQPLPPEPVATTQLSKEKLNALYHDRQKTIDATLQSMDPV